MGSILTGVAKLVHICKCSFMLWQGNELHGRGRFKEALQKYLLVSIAVAAVPFYSLSSLNGAYGFHYRHGLTYAKLQSHFSY